MAPNESRIALDLAQPDAGDRGIEQTSPVPACARPEDASRGKTRSLPATAPAPKSKSLRLAKEAGKSPDRLIAEAATSAPLTAATVVTAFSKGNFGELSLADAAVVLREKTEAIQRGDLQEAESLLLGQAVALNTMFTELARRAAMNLGQNLDTTDRYLRLALKAQGQCRATVETLATLKQPRVVIARQTNVTSGPQQINNGTHPHVGKSHFAPDELMEDHDERTDIRLDAGTARAPSSPDQGMAPLGGLDGAEN